MTSPRRIEVLYAGRCRSVIAALARVREALSVVAGLEIDVEIRLIRVDDFAEAVVHRMRGTPTVRVDGIDVRDGTSIRRPVGTYPRHYHCPANGDERAPDVASIARALERAAER